MIPSLYVLNYEEEDYK